MANNPVVFNTNVSVWTKIATNVTTGLITILKPTTSHKVTYRLTGGTAPNNTNDVADSPKVQCLSIEIKNDVGIDVYLWTIPGNGTGKVTVYT